MVTHSRSATFKTHYKHLQSAAENMNAECIMQILIYWKLTCSPNIKKSLASNVCTSFHEVLKMDITSTRSKTSEYSNVSTTPKYNWAVT